MNLSKFPTTPLIDIGVNLTDSCFEQDRHEVLQRGRDAGINAFMMTGTTEASSEQAADLCAELANCFSTAGIHPHHAKDFNSQSINNLALLAKKPNVKAIGETGLDFNRNFSTPAQQEKAFLAQIELACQLQLPLFCHERDAAQRFHDIIKDYRSHLKAVVLHCFTGDQKALFQCLDLDLHIGITGWICDERRGHHLHSLITNIPDNRLMVETDAPYLLPRTLKPKPKTRRNEPCNLPYIVDCIATYTNKSYEQVAMETTDTAQQFFNLPN